MFVREVFKQLAKEGVKERERERENSRGGGGGAKRAKEINVSWMRSKRP
jgi:hypothetical protein